MDDTLRSARAKVWAYLFLGALGVRLLFLTQYANSPFFWVPSLDALYHDLHARAILAGHLEPRAFFRAPLYLYFLAGIYRVFGHSFWAARLAQACLGSGSCVLLYELGQRVFRPTVAMLSAGMMALYGPLVFFDGELLTPVLEVFLDLAFLLLAVRASESGSKRAWLVAGGVLGLAAITRPNVLVVLPAALLLLWKPDRTCRSSRVAGPMVALLIGASLAPGLVTWRNLRVAGDPVFIASQGGINLFLGNRPEADGFTPSTPKRFRSVGEYEDSVALYGQRAAEEALGRPLSASQAQQYWIGRVLRWWREEAARALCLTGKKWVLAWTHREIRNNHAFDFVRAEFAPCLWFMPFGFWLAGPLGLLGMTLAWKKGSQARSLVLFVLLYVASFVLFFVADRYRLPVVPVLLLFAAHAMLWLGERARRREARRLAPALAALTLFVNVDWYRTATPATLAQDYWCAGNALQQMGRLEEAERQHRKALALDPANAEIWTNLGVDRYQGGHLAEAAALFHRATELAPASSGPYFNLAMCELQLGRPGQARRYLRQAVRIDPEHARARAELSRLEGSG
jgi:tetratricopeptide (TPR) repeat protein